MKVMDFHRSKNGSNLLCEKRNLFANLFTHCEVKTFFFILVFNTIHMTDYRVQLSASPNKKIVLHLCVYEESILLAYVPVESTILLYSDEITPQNLPMHSCLIILLAAELTSNSL